MLINACQVCLRALAQTWLMFYLLWNCLVHLFRFQPYRLEKSVSQSYELTTSFTQPAQMSHHLVNYRKLEVVAFLIITLILYGGSICKLSVKRQKTEFTILVCFRSTHHCSTCGYIFSFPSKCSIPEFWKLVVWVNPEFNSGVSPYLRLQTVNFSFLIIEACPGIVPSSLFF